MSFGFGFGFPRRAGGFLWTPAQLSTALWLDAADANTITLNGTTVSQWSDKSGNGRNATQATTANQPTYTLNGLNNKPVLTFDGTNDSMAAPLVFSGNPSFTIYALWNTDQAATEVVFFNGVAAAGQGAGIGYNAISVAYNVFLWAVGEAAVNPSLAAYTPVIQGATRDAGTGATTLNINGGTRASNTLGALSIPTVGAATAIGNGGGFFVRGKLGEIIVVSSLLTIADQQKLEGYLAWKWGTQASLPVSHPYYSAPPLA